MVRAIPPPYPNRESRYETIDGVKLHYVCRGKGPDILLLHGIAANIYCWRYMIPLLEKKYRVWAVDIKGFGLSDKPRKSSYNLEAQSGLLLKFLERHQIENLAIVGNSMGGAIGAGMAIRDPHRISKLILINSAHDSRIFNFLPAGFKVMRRAVGPAVPLIKPFVNKEFVRKYMKALYSDKYKISDADVSAYLAPYVQDLAGYFAFLAAVDSMLDDALTLNLKKSGVPVLILWGESDKLVNIRWGKELHRMIPGSQFQSHPTAGHHLQEEEPQWAADRIAEFV